MKTKKFIGVLLGIFFATAGILLFKMNWFLALVITVGGIILLVNSLMNLMNNIKASKTVEENEMHQDMQTESESNKVEFQETDYKEDSFLLLSILKDNANCSVSEIFSETEEEKFNKKFLSIEENQIFKRCSYSDIFQVESDGGETPDIYWVMVNENMQFTEAVNLYIEMKEYLNHFKFNGFTEYLEYFRSKCFIESFDFSLMWCDKTTFFVTEEDVQLPSDKKDEFIKKCRMNNVHIVKHPKEFEFIDVFDSKKYILDYYTYPGSADDAATYADYTLKKIDSEVKTDKEKLSDKILNGILHSYCDKKYYHDILLNQINIKIPLDKERLYFFTVYVNASTGLINKFSFDIEAASDTHYEFDLSGAEKLREMCIESLPDNRYYNQSLDKLMIEYLSKCDGSSLESLVRSISTAVFHFD